MQPQREGQLGLSNSKIKLNILTLCYRHCIATGPVTFFTVYNAAANGVLTHQYIVMVIVIPLIYAK